MKTKVIGGFDSRMENKVKFSQTREFRPTRCCSRDMEIARQCLVDGNLTLMYLFGNARMDKLRSFAKTKEFSDLIKEYQQGK